MAFSFGGQSSAAQTAGQSNFFKSGPASSSSTGLFGGSTGFSFGGSSAASSSTFANPFGQPASSAGSFFGASSSSFSSPSLFGGSSSSFSFSSPSLFGGSSQPASALSLFGGSKSAFGGFGQPASSSAQAGSLFGNTQSQLVLGGFAPGAAPQPDFSALKELESIHNACEPSSPQCKFTYLFLNVVDNPAARVKPPNVDELQWRAALQRAGGLDNPDRLWPVQAKGFKDLIARKNAQDDALKEYSTRVEAAEQASRHLARTQQTLIRDRIDAVRRRHLELSHMLLRIMRYIDALESRLAAFQGQWDARPQQAVTKLRHDLRALENAIAPNSAGGLQRKVEALSTAARLRQGSPGALSDIPGLDDGSLSKLYDYLARQAKGIATLQERLRRDGRDASILEKSSKTTQTL